VWLAGTCSTYRTGIWVRRIAGPALRGQEGAQASCGGSNHWSVSERRGRDSNRRTTKPPMLIFETAADRDGKSARGALHLHFGLNPAAGTTDLAAAESIRHRSSTVLSGATSPSKPVTNPTPQRISAASW
jgi:hypothetical protein